MQNSVRSILLFSGAACLAIPPLVFLIAAFGAELSLNDAFAAMVEQFVAPRQNLLVCGALGLFPLTLLGLILWALRRFAPKIRYRSMLALGGVLPILVVLVWVNFDFWPHFLPSQTYPGFPHGLGFVIGPGIFAPIGMIGGMVIAWLISRNSI